MIPVELFVYRLDDNSRSQGSVWTTVLNTFVHRFYKVPTTPIIMLNSRVSLLWILYIVSHRESFMILHLWSTNVRTFSLRLSFRWQHARRGTGDWDSLLWSWSMRPCNPPLSRLETRERRNYTLDTDVSGRKRHLKEKIFCFDVKTLGYSYTSTYWTSWEIILMNVLCR